MKVLIVEDHADLAAIVGEYLETHGCTVDYAADGPAALRRVEAEPYDVILLDRMLPGLDGVEVCRRLRRGPRASIPILMLTALDATEERVEGFEAGADDYLAKPFALAELRARLEALHRRAQRAVGQAPLAVEDLEYDPQSLRASRAGQAIDLAPAPRKLLEYLMRHSDRVVTRAELEALLWSDAVPDGDVLRAHIHNLRRAIDKPFSHKLLQTVPGGGYRLGAGR